VNSVRFAGALVEAFASVSIQLAHALRPCRDCTDSPGCSMSQASLPFEADGAGPPRQLLPRDGSALLHLDVLDVARATATMNILLNTIPWEQRSVRLFGKSVPQPRLVAWFGDDGSYTYSGLRLGPHPWPSSVQELRRLCEGVAGTRFNSGLANLYRDGKDTVAWHADDEPELGDRPTIASLSLGAARRFDLRHRETGETVRTVLPAGSILVMSGESQRAWIHQVPRMAKVSEPRINLTFRWVGEDV
jgi:alkylated DNA repair dioxygenase AlkB